MYVYINVLLHNTNTINVSTLTLLLFVYVTVLLHYTESTPVHPPLPYTTDSLWPSWAKQNRQDPPGTLKHVLVTALRNLRK